MVIGKLIHEERTMFGPGLINAYDAEREAKNPRITIDDAIISKMQEYGVWPKNQIRLHS